MLKILDDRYPFLTLMSYAGMEYVGVVQNRDDSVTTLYDFGALTDRDRKKSFLELAAAWWWESNRSVPINIFLGEEWLQFRDLRRTFSNRDLVIIHGPACSLRDIAHKKNRRRSVIMVRRVS